LKTDTLNIHFAFMKKLILSLALAGTVVCISCSKDNDDSDVIIGTWVSQSTVGENVGSEQTSLEVWKFNDDTSGAYTKSSKDMVELESKFVWIKMDSLYQIDYAKGAISDDTFSIGELMGEIALEDREGNHIAVRE